MNKCIALLLSLSAAALPLAAQTTTEKTDNGWRLIADGQPFEVKGATFGYGEDVDNYDAHFQDLQSLGVNTIRTWGTDEFTGQLLDAAHRHGMKVMVGIWMRHGRPGMEDDDRFNYLEDTEGMEAMYANAVRTVEACKDHPAVLAWGVGNEVYLNTATDAEKEAYSKLLERICRKIKELDPDHPVASVEAWTFGLDWWQKYVPSIDIYGLNIYGAGASLLAAELEKRGIDKPYIVTEFGPTGEWDMPEDENGVKVEPTDQQKYDAIARGYTQWIKSEPSCLGACFFHYANGADFLSIWLFTHFRGMRRPQYWAIREAYTGQEPANYVPRIQTFELPGAERKGGAWVPVALKASDAENEALEVSFYYNQRTGSRKRRDQVLPLNARGNATDGFEIQLPQVDGPAKIYVAVKDTYNNVGIASTSLVVSDEEARAKKYLVPRATLPFYVYKDNGDLPYAPSGYMGNYEAMEVDLGHAEGAHSGNTCIKVSYKARENWYGLAFVDPANDWGDILGGYDLTGAKTFRFWAKASMDGVKATIGFGLIDKDKPFPDTGKKSVDVVLTTEWKQYAIKTRKVDLSCIRSGLVLFSSSDGFSHEIFLDDVVFE
ncbi:MAG: hypothetical protein J5I98_18400 [Phaeodactylibacter sp.]|nr:hypothetical protein [Phaeodactylibacter sp.]